MRVLWEIISTLRPAYFIFFYFFKKDLTVRLDGFIRLNGAFRLDGH